MRQSCCAIVIVFIFVAFLKFNSIDAGCAGSRHTVVKKPIEFFPNKGEWREYCGGPMVPGNENGCNNHLFQPCIINAATDKCEAKSLKAELDLTPNETWDTFCENIQEGCTETGIKPCRWHTYIRGDEACVAKRSREIFAEATDGEKNDEPING
ncbi:hypothetical protein niasHS_016093 [Heterodera schachtii]|uniref:Uncharacterized protein n=1 Tax=Heterodera schachtii TaxID=97005 RepID=A0ABD2HTT1_HETSC